MRRTVARITVGPARCGIALLEARVMVFLWRFARWDIVGVSALRGTCFHTLALYPSLGSSQSSFFRLGTSSRSGSSSSDGAERLPPRPDLAARSSSCVCVGRRCDSLGIPNGRSLAQMSSSSAESCWADGAIFTCSRRHCLTGRPVEIGETWVSYCWGKAVTLGRASDAPSKSSGSG